MSEYKIIYVEDTEDPILKIGDTFKSKSRTENKFYHYATIAGIENNLYVCESGLYKMDDPIYKVKKILALNKEDGEYEFFGNIGKGAKWVKDGDVFTNRQIEPIYVIPVRKTYRNGEKEYEIYVDYLPNISDIESEAMAWAARDSSGANYGWQVFWDEKPVYVKYYKLLGPCGHFH